MISLTSSFASSTPATSLNVTLASSLFSTRCRERPKLPSMPAPPAEERNCRKTKNQKNAMMRIHGTTPIRICMNGVLVGS